MRKAKIGENLYGLRVVKSFDGTGASYNEPFFSEFEGIIVWNTWDTGDMQVLYGWTENGEYYTREIGNIDDDQFYELKTGKEKAEFIKREVAKLLLKQEYKVSEHDVKQELLNSGIVATRKFEAMQHISRKSFNALVDKMTEYVNSQIEIASLKMQIQLQIQMQNLNFPIAIDDVIASIIICRDEE